MVFGEESTDIGHENVQHSRDDKSMVFCKQECSFLGLLSGRRGWGLLTGVFFPKFGHWKEGVWVVNRSVLS